MQEEYPPIVQVTDTGVVVGPVSYESAHPRDPNTPGIRHLTANVFVFEDNSYSRLLLTRRSGGIDRGGILNVCIGGNAIWLKNEQRAQTPPETAVNELEEIFYQTPIPESFGLRGLISFPKDLRINDPEYVHLFEGIYQGPFSLQPDEVSEAFFVNIEELLRDLEINPSKYVKSANFYLGKYLQTRKP